MEHDQRACSRCGEPAADYHFCPSCLTPIATSSELNTGAGTQLLAASGAGGDPVAGNASVAVQVEADQPSADSETASPDPGALAPQQVARLEDVLSPSSESRRGAPDEPRGASMPPPEIRVEIRHSPQVPRDVARLEDVLSVQPEARTQTSVAPPQPTPPPVHPGHEDDQRIAPRTAAAAVPEADLKPPLSAEATAETSIAPPEVVKPGPGSEAPTLAPMYVAAHRLRSAFLFEQTAAFESHGDHDEILQAVEVTEEVPAPPIAELAPEPETDTDPPADQPDWQSRWLAAVALIALIALVVALTGRKPCRCAD